jgi:hypothetical protein
MLDTENIKNRNTQMTKLKDLLAENMRRFGTKNLQEQSGDIEYLKQIIDFDPSDLGSIDQQIKYSKELEELDNFVDTDESIPNQVIEKVFDLSDYYIGSRGSMPSGIPDAKAFIEFLTKYKKLVARYKNLTEQDKYQTLGQSGEIPMLDPDADTEVFESSLDRLEKNYMLVKPKRVDASEFKNDVRDLISIYKDKAPAEARKTYYKAFFDLYPYVTTNSAYKSIVSSMMNQLNFLLKHAYDVQKGDTSNYGYRVFPRQKEKGIQ